MVRPESSVSAAHTGLPGTLLAVEPGDAYALSGIIVVTSAITLYGVVTLPVSFTDPPLGHDDPWFWVASVVAPVLVLTSASVLSGGVNESLAAFVLALLWVAAVTLGMVAERRRSGTAE